MELITRHIDEVSSPEKKRGREREAGGGEGEKEHISRRSITLRNQCTYNRRQSNLIVGRDPGRPRNFVVA